MPKKDLPPSQPPVDPEQKREDDYVSQQLDLAIDNMLQHVMNPVITVDTASIAQGMAMLVALAHKKGVTQEFFMGVLDDAVAGLSTIEGLKSEMRLLKALNLPLTEQNKDALMAAAQFSAKQVQAARAGMYEKFKLLRQCKPDGVTPH